MKEIDDDLESLKNTKGVLFKDALKIAEKHFGEYRQEGSHRIFKMPWAGDPRINLQPDKKMAKGYQVKQLIKALKKLKESKNEKPR